MGFTSLWLFASELQSAWAWGIGKISVAPDDNKFVDCIIIANADYIVSLDTYFDILKTIAFPKVNVIRIEEFVNLWKP